MPHQNRLSRQLRPVKNLDRREERIHIDVKDGAGGLHAFIVVKDEREGPIRVSWQQKARALQRPEPFGCSFDPAA